MYIVQRFIPKRTGSLSLYHLHQKTVKNAEINADGKKRNLTLDKRQEVPGMIDAEMTVTAVARQIVVHHNTISRLKA